MSRPGDFWARRKAAVQAEAEADVAAAKAQEEDAARALQEEKTDAELLEELNLPDPDSLQLGDDVRGFMSKAVPDRLRRRALRQLWKLNPVLANVDGLVDYGEDFTDSALVVENLQTAYQVGKGMLAHVEEMARQAEEKAAADLAESQDSGADAPLESDLTRSAQAPEIPQDSSTPEDADTGASTATEAPEPDLPEETQENQSDTRYAAVGRRRMRFVIEG